MTILHEGWWLMSTSDLERELERWRGREAAPSRAAPLSTEEALAYRNAGNLPDEHDRTLRLVLEINTPDDLSRIDSKRLRYEPDYHEAPEWRREGSRPVNVVPLRRPDVTASDAAGPWWEEPPMAELEREWQRTGAVAGVRVPEGYRGFVYKTVVALRAAGRPVTKQTIADSVARWTSDEDATRLRRALEETTGDDNDEGPP